MAAAKRPGATAWITPVNAGQVNDIQAPSGFAIRAATTWRPMPRTSQSSVRWSTADLLSAAGLAAVVHPHSYDTLR